MLLFTKNHAFDKSETFSDFAESLKQRILHQSLNYSWCDIMADRYFQESLKENIWSILRQISKKHFSNEMEIPGSSKNDFLIYFDSIDICVTKHSWKITLIGWKRCINNTKPKATGG